MKRIRPHGYCFANSVCAIGVLAASGITYAQVAPPPVPVSNAPAPVLTEPFQVQYGGSVPRGQPTATPIELSLREALRRGLQFNLGVLTNRDIVATARAEREKALSVLLPEFSAGATQVSEQINLAVFGFNFSGVPAVVGPFGYQDARAYAQQTIYDRPSLRNLKSATETRRAAELSAEDARNLVVQAVSNAYLQIIVDAARVDATQAQVVTAQTLFDRASDQRRAGTVPGIDVLRAEVQLRTEQQQLLAQKNQVEKDRLALGRVIGFADGQPFTLTDALPFAPLNVSPDEMLKQAYDYRPDYKAALANIRAAEFALQAAHSEHWPQVVVQADYGAVGKTFAQSHGAYDLVAGVRVPIYSGGRSRADIEQAEATLRDKRNAAEDLRGRIAYEVRNAMLDLQSAADQVAVARNNVELATQTVAQAQDRFSAGVADNVEVVQAQQLLASANDSYIAALGAHNAAKIALAAAVGRAEDDLPQFLNLARGRPARP